MFWSWKATHLITDDFPCLITDVLKLVSYTSFHWCFPSLSYTSDDRCFPMSQDRCFPTSNLRCFPSAGKLETGEVGRPQSCVCLQRSSPTATSTQELAQNTTVYTSHCNRSKWAHFYWHVDQDSLRSYQISWKKIINLQGLQFDKVKCDVFWKYIF